MHKLYFIFAVTLLSLAFTGCSKEREVNNMNKTSAVLATGNTTLHQQQITFAMGCFWGAEKRFALIPGVIDVVSGYADGSGFNATYENIIKAENRFNPDNYAEVIQVTFNPAQVAVEMLIKRFFELHDPTQLNQQGNDIGTQYRSAIYYQNEQQQQLATAIKDQFQPLLTQQGFGTIQTLIKPLDNFVAAEEYHQDYLQKNPNGYCPNLATGVKFQNSDSVTSTPQIDNSAITQGKHIVVVDSEFCPYCDKLKAETVNDYQGDIPLHFRQASQLTGLTVTSPTWATPTLLFTENGVEKYAIQGFVNKKDFYKALGFFKLGDSEAFRVAFEKGTDSRFCKQYDLFKDTPDGVFIDAVSDVPLFDTDYRFNSGSGWLSFTQAIEDAVYYVEDNSYGMQRVEVRSALSDIHLGHVFNDGPNGKPRYCINATVLEFRAR